MFKKLFFLQLFLILTIFSTQVFAAQMSQILWGGLKKSDVADLKEFARAIEKDDYKKAIAIAKKMESSSSFDDAAMRIALWNKYSQITSGKVDPKNVSFSDISRFVNDGKFFPNFYDLRKSAEKVAVVNNVPYNISRQYFKSFPASDVDSKIYLLKSEISHSGSVAAKDPSDNLQKDIEDLTVNIWINEDFNPKEEAKFLTNYGNKLTEENHVARINRLLWENEIDDARRILYLVNDDYQKLVNGIINIHPDAKYINKIISDIPRSLRGNEVLAYRVIQWKRTQTNNDEGDIDDIVDMLLSIPDNVSNPSKWWPLKKLYARERLKTKDYKDAYKLASSHGLKVNDRDFADAEWTAGWIALRFLDKPKVAYDHFYNLYLNVGYPISISRAAYWLGMASQENGDKKKAIEWYKIAAKYPVYFYGQLAIHKHRLLDPVNAGGDIILPKDPDPSSDDVASMAKNDALKIGYILALTGDKKSAMKIFEYAMLNSRSEGEISVIMKVVNEMNDPSLDASLSKVAARKNVFFIKDKFQIIKEIENDTHAPLVHAIIKQESGFSKTALSSAGAIGFMQLMPKTAELVCRQIGVKYSKKKLSHDKVYNVKIGSYYIKALIDQFDGSEILAIASYNAGPNATKRWVNDFYDPRQTKDVDKVVDWIEMITYAETRNYVQRIMENLIVYKYLMSRTNYDAIR